MKLKVTPAKPAEEPKDNPPKKGKKLKVKQGEITNTQYGIYTGIINEDGKHIDHPTETEAVINMAKYMKNNKSDQSDSPSNVYRPAFSHMGIAYDRKKKQTGA